MMSKKKQIELIKSLAINIQKLYQIILFVIATHKNTHLECQLSSFVFFFNSVIIQR